MVVKQIDILSHGCADPVDEVAWVSLEVRPEHLIDLLVEDYDLGNLYFNIVQQINVLNWKGVNPCCDAILRLHDSRPD